MYQADCGGWGLSTKKFICYFIASYCGVGTITNQYYQRLGTMSKALAQQVTAELGVNSGVWTPEQLPWHLAQ